MGGKRGWTERTTVRKKKESRRGEDKAKIAGDQD